MEIFTQSTFDRWPLEDKSVQAIITSPPYFGLRKYEIPDVTIGNWKGQYGLEPTIQLYIEHTLLWCKEAWRVLKDDGVFFLNIGDSYGGSWGDYAGHSRGGNRWIRKGGIKKEKPPTADATKKCKLLVPHRVAIALVDLGWTLRNDIVWHKENSMPESVSDRFSKKFEMVFMFMKQRKYQFDLDAVKIPFTEPERIYNAKTSTHKGAQIENRAYKGLHDGRQKYGDIEKGKNPGDVWIIPTSPSPDAHYAMWPEKLVERMLLCSTRPGDVILDPFAGSGTTLRVADKHNRIAYGIDLGYQEIQKRRMTGIQKNLL